MNVNSEQIVSCQVLLRAANGQRPDSRSRIVAENIAEWMPSQETVDFVREKLRSSGFEVGEVVGNGMSITGPAHLFESIFRVRLERTPGKGIQFKSDDRTPTYELPKKHMPSDLVEGVVAITFTPPPDFGPTDFSS